MNGFILFNPTLLKINISSEFQSLKFFSITGRVTCPKVHIRIPIYYFSSIRSDLYYENVSPTASHKGVRAVSFIKRYFSSFANLFKMYMVVFVPSYVTPFSLKF